MVRYRKVPPAAAANQIAEKARIPHAHEWKKINNIFWLQVAAGWPPEPHIYIFQKCKIESLQ